MKRFGSPLESTTDDKGFSIPGILMLIGVLVLIEWWVVSDIRRDKQ